MKIAHFYRVNEKQHSCHRDGHLHLCSPRNGLKVEEWSPSAQAELSLEAGKYTHRPKEEAGEELQIESQTGCATLGNTSWLSLYMLIYEVRTLDISSIVSVSSNFLVVCFFYNLQKITREKNLILFSICNEGKTGITFKLKKTKKNCPFSLFLAFSKIYFQSTAT